MEYHEAANIFPLDEEHIGELAEDIRTNKQHVPIDIYRGKILDGRRRYLACLRAGVAPITRDLKTDDPVSYVLSLNLQRRHLSKSQSMMAAAEAKKLQEKYAEAARKRQRKGQEMGRQVEKGLRPAGLKPSTPHQSRDDVGKAFGIGGRTVDRGIAILNRGAPEVVDAAKSGAISGRKAEEIAKLRSKGRVQESLATVPVP